MTSHARGQRRYRNQRQRRIDVVPGDRYQERPRSVGRFYTTVELEQARHEADAQADADVFGRGEASHA